MAEARESNRERELCRLARLRRRVRQVRDREVRTHERAVELHEQGARLQDRLGYHDRAEQARKYAALARERIQLARAEQARWETALASFSSRR